MFLQRQKRRCLSSRRAFSNTVISKCELYLIFSSRGQVADGAIVAYWGQKKRGIVYSIEPVGMIFVFCEEGSRIDLALDFVSKLTTRV